MSFLRRAARAVSAPVLILVVSVLATTGASTLAIAGPGAGFLQANVGSRVAVDYSADEVALKIAPLSPEIIDAVRRDREREANEASWPGTASPQAPGHGAQPTPGPSGGVMPTPTPTPVPTPTVIVPTLPVPTPSLLPLPSLPPIPTVPPTPTLPPRPTLPPTPTLPPLP